MTKMEKIVLLLAFWHSPWGAAKAAAWEWLTYDRPYEEETLFQSISYIINGVDDRRLEWEALEAFYKEKTSGEGVDVV